MLRKNRDFQILVVPVNVDCSRRFHPYCEGGQSWQVSVSRGGCAVANGRGPDQHLGVLQVIVEIEIIRSDIGSQYCDQSP